MSMVRRLRARGSEDGFTLIEMMAALLVFSIATLGIVPLLATSMHGSAISRSFTVNKNLSQEAMERIRGLSYFVSYASQNRRVDVLDLYYPNLSTGYSSGTFTTTCTSATASIPACPKNLPIGTTMTFKASFVRTSTYSTTPVTYAVVLPPAGYRWDSLTGADVPPSQLLEISVTTDWEMMSGENKSITTKTLLADRKVGTTKVRGTGRVDYAVQVLTGYNVSGAKSSLNFTGSHGESKVETKLLSVANESISAGTLRLLRSSDDPTVLGTDLGSSPLSGASSVLAAPPDVTPAAVSAGTQALVHPEFISKGSPVTVGWLDSSSATTLKAVVANELPTSTGLARTPTTSNLAAYVTNQADATTDSLLQVDSGEPMFEIARSAATSRTMQAETSAVTTAATAADRKVETFADARLGDLRLSPVKFINSNGAGGVGTGNDDHVIRLFDFSGRATCKATASAATATATGTWTARLLYWVDSTNDGARNGAYVTENLTSATATARLEAIQASNPLVNDAPLAEDDVYLFQTATQQGYYTDWSAVAPTATKSADGRVANVNLDGAIRIDTSPTNQAIPESVMSVSIGKMSCEAVDNR